MAGEIFSTRPRAGRPKKSNYDHKANPYKGNTIRKHCWTNLEEKPKTKQKRLLLGRKKNYYSNIKKMDDRWEDPYEDVLNSKKNQKEVFYSLNSQKGWEFLKVLENDKTILLQTVEQNGALAQAKRLYQKYDYELLKKGYIPEKENKKNEVEKAGFKTMKGGKVFRNARTTSKKSMKREKIGKTVMEYMEKIHNCKYYYTIIDWKNAPVSYKAERPFSPHWNWRWQSKHERKEYFKNDWKTGM